jgi:NAD(P)-dependent dehydrogenase (short-subunit alcohol dehydrogenase family)
VTSRVRWHSSLEQAGALVRAVEQAIQTFGRLDILINNAGVHGRLGTHRGLIATLRLAYGISRLTFEGNHKHDANGGAATQFRKVVRRARREPCANAV